MRNESDDRSTDEDLTREFWGTGRDWFEGSGRTPRVPRSGDTGRRSSVNSFASDPDNPVTGAIRAVKDSWAAFRPQHSSAQRSVGGADTGAMPRTRQHDVVRPGDKSAHPARTSNRSGHARKRVAANELTISDLGSGRRAEHSIDAWDALDDWSELDALTASHEALRASRAHRVMVESPLADNASYPAPSAENRIQMPAAAFRPSAGRDRRGASPSDHDHRSEQDFNIVDGDEVDDRFFADEHYDDGYPAEAYEVPLSTQLAGRLGWRGADPLLVKFVGAALMTLILLPVLMLRGGNAPADQTGDPIAAPVVSTAPLVTAPLATQAAVAPTASAPATAAPTAPAAAATAPPTAAAVVTASTAAQKSTSGAGSPTKSADKSSEKSSDDGSSSEGASPSSSKQTSAPKSTAPDCSATYTAVEGDSWWGIADRAGTTLKKLLAQNGANENTVILPGKKICLPQGASTPAPPKTTNAPKPTDAPKTTSAPTTTAAPKKTDPPTTTNAPTTTSAPTTTESGGSSKTYTTEQVKQIIRDVFPDELEDKALDIAYRESRYNPKADNGWCCHGIFQIYYTVHKSWLKNFGINSQSDLYNPKLNAEAALELYRRAGNSWSPWTTA